MMNNGEGLEFLLHREYHRERMRQADAARLARVANGDARPALVRWHRPLLARVGSGLVAWGAALQARYGEGAAELARTLDEMRPADAEARLRTR